MARKNKSKATNSHSVHILVIDGTSGMDDGDNNVWVFNDSLAMYQLFRTYGYHPDYITTHEPPPSPVQYGNIPTIIYDPIDEQSPSSRWSPTDPKSIKLDFLAWIESKSQTSGQDDTIVISLSTHGSFDGLVQLGIYKLATGLSERNSMTSHEIYDLIKLKFPTQQIYLLFDFCGAGLVANKLPKTFFRPRGSSTNPTVILNCSAVMMSDSNPLGNGSQWTTEFFKSLITRTSDDKRSISDQHKKMRRTLHLSYQLFCVPTLSCSPSKRSRVQERNFLFRKRPDNLQMTKIDFNRPPEFIPNATTRTFHRGIISSVAVVLKHKMDDLDYNFLKEGNVERTFPVPYQFYLSPC